MSRKDLLIGMAIGAAAAYIADPQGGRRRRAMARDQFIRASRKTRRALDATARDVANRTAGLVATTRGRWSRESVENRRLVERVRAQLGRVSSHPHAIDVEAVDGIVTLRGPILAREMDDVLAVVWAVRGVLAVNNALDAFDSPDGIPALQGESWVEAPSLDMVPRWIPATPALMTAAGLAATGLAVAAYARRSPDPDDLTRGPRQ